MSKAVSKSQLFLARRVMVFRFFLQPTMAAMAAWRDGVDDARAARPWFSREQDLPQ